MARFLIYSLPYREWLYRERRADATMTVCSFILAFADNMIDGRLRLQPENTHR